VDKLTLNPSLEVAGLLLDAGSVMPRTDEPFRLPSGWASPVYMDCRRLMSFPGIRRSIVAHALARLRADGALTDVAAVAGAEASGIALAAWIAEALDLPLLYVRKKSAGHSHVEGIVEAGRRVLLVDDLMAAGQSKVAFLKALTAAGATVKDALVVFDYGTFAAERMLADRNLRVHALATWEDVFAVAKERGSLGTKALEELGAFLHDPGQWSQEHGGIGTSPALN